MRDDWESHHGSQELDNPEPWHSPEFHLMSRNQQNTEIYKVNLNFAQYIIIV